MNTSININGHPLPGCFQMFVKIILTPAPRQFTSAKVCKIRRNEE